MSKSLKRVSAALESAGIEGRPVEATETTRTAAEAAAALGVEVDQIGKSIILRGEVSDRAVLFLTAGGNRVDAALASALAGESLGKADAALIRAQTGFAIGGVAPVGHLKEIRGWIDRRLLDFDVVWCAAGTPRHNFPVDPRQLIETFGLVPGDFTS
ncbi:YbaK/EbsC family protein [Palleronia sp. LCG004]|uniref:YbaK/EbsC family protein n=1 Tax=Palleronia sp. LCG004 TaxID=3079304 RepID=UPI002943B2D6|nr:YbaK/EbsC family protein [Palleronia sp. LCG004]WOI55185.1 YbaK/EbsC family protein [Palleronia sp. LCG004]